MTSYAERVHPSCYGMVDVIEDLLDRRRQEAVRGLRPRRTWRNSDYEWIKEWSRSELVDLAYPSYRAMLQGKIQKPPQRDVVMKIADYLECTVAERNRLLTSAQYLPEPMALEGEALNVVMAVARDIIDYVPMPAYMITRDWNIHIWNKYVLTLFGLTEAQIESIPPAQRNVLQFIFDTRLPVFDLLNGNPEMWDYTARLNLFGFKHNNLHYQYEDWYIEKVESLMELPKFAEYWPKVQVDTHVLGDPTTQVPFYVTDIVTPAGVYLKIRGLQIELTQTNDAHVVAYIPVGLESRGIFTAVGLPTSDNNWGTVGSTTSTYNPY